MSKNRRQSVVNSNNVGATARIAYFIMIHRFPEQFKRMFKAIYHPKNHYLVHLDKKSDPDTLRDIQDFLTLYPNAYILERENVVWGGYSMVQAELNGMKYLLGITAQWDYFINLSGQDFPLQSQEYIRDFLGRSAGKNFIKVANQIVERPDTMNRVDNYYTETTTGFSGIPFQRPFLTGVVSYIGGQWMMLTRACCSFLCTSDETTRFEQYYKNTFIPDESFFQTVLMNTSFAGEIVNDDKRAIIWIPDGDIKLRPKTFTHIDAAFLLNSNHLFARKFDDNTDASIVTIIEQRLKLPFIPSRNAKMKSSVQKKKMLSAEHNKCK